MLHFHQKIVGFFLFFIFLCLALAKTCGWYLQVPLNYCNPSQSGYGKLKKEKKEEDVVLAHKPCGVPCIHLPKNGFSDLKNNI